MIAEILRFNKTVFTFEQLVLLFPDIPATSLKKRLNYYIKQGELYHIRRGISETLSE
jgi:hypothetical protein